MHRFLTVAAGAILLVAASCSSPSSRETAAGTAPAARATAAPGAAKFRRLEVSYGVTVPEAPAGTKELKVWVPKPRSEGDVQVVHSAKLVPPAGARVIDGKDATGETAFWCVVVPNPSGPVAFTAVCDVTRREHKNNDFRNVGKAELTVAQKTALAGYLKPNALVPNDGEPAQIATRAVKQEANRLNEARAIYDEVLGRMRYSKEGTGWGRGDTLWACGSGYGNCTDFHSMFMSMGRSRGIPARFYMGMSVPETRGEGAIGGYHCWAEFYVAEIGWVPIDISEADKFPELAQYYFGSLTEDRVSFTMGRDLVLDPAPASGVQNFFIYPIAEADGKPVKADRAFKYRDL